MVLAGQARTTVNATAPLVPPLVVTVTFAAPGAALAAIVKVAVIRVGLATVTLPTVTPGFATATVAPETKLVPLSATDTTAPAGPVAGVSEVRAGAGQAGRAAAVNATKANRGRRAVSVAVGISEINL